MKPSPYERWYVANTIGKTGRKCQASRLATKNAAPAEAAKYSPANPAQRVMNTDYHQAEPLRRAPAAPSSSTTPMSRQAPGIRCLQEAGFPCFRSTETFQNPYWKYWRNRAVRRALGLYQEAIFGDCQIFPPEKMRRRFSSSSWLRLRLSSNKPMRS